ncbi:MAG: hypothetical protein Q9183_002546 [Haloplaca sp. 2 TL-2023]
MVMVNMYHDVRQTNEDNTPDTWLPSRAGGGAGPGADSDKEARKGSTFETVAYPDVSEYGSDANDTAAEDNNADNASTASPRRKSVQGPDGSAPMKPNASAGDDAVANGSAR